MPGKIIAPLIGLALMGCATTTTNTSESFSQKAKADFDAAVANCRAQYPDRYQKPVTPRVSCLQDAATAYSERLATRNPNVPLEQQRARSEKIKALAQRFDAGEMSQADYDAAVQQADAEFRQAAGTS